MADSIVIPNPGNLRRCYLELLDEANNPICGYQGVLNSLPSQQKMETPLAKKKHRRIKSNSRTLDGTEGSFLYIHLFRFSFVGKMACRTCS